MRVIVFFAGALHEQSGRAVGPRAWRTIQLQGFSPSHACRWEMTEEKGGRECSAVRVGHDLSLRLASDALLDKPAPTSREICRGNVSMGPFRVLGLGAT